MMNPKSSVDAFLTQRKIAIAGVSRSGKKFGNNIFKELKSKGYTVYGVNPNGGTIDGETLYKGFGELPEPVGGTVIVVNPRETEKTVKDAVEAGIKNIWIQQGAESDRAIDFCRTNNVNVVSGECIMMFAEPLASFHKIHRWIWKLVGKYPR